MDQQESQNIVKVRELAISCNGEEQGSGHPKVYLHIVAKEGKIDCPYCGRTFRYVGA